MDFSALNASVLDVFGETVSIEGVSVPAIFDSRHFAIEDGEAGASDLITTISVRTSDIPVALTDATAIIVRGVVYRRFETRPDGEGMTAITLERVS